MLKLNLMRIFFVVIFVLFFCACSQEFDIDKIDTAKPFKLEIFKGKGVKIQVSENAILADFEKPAIYNFFASWCASCKVEAQILSNLHLNLGDKVRIIGVLMEDLSTQEIEAFKDDFGVNYDIAVGWGNLIFDKALQNTFGVPFTIITDKNGTIVLRHNGVLDAEIAQRLIDGLL